MLKKPLPDLKTHEFTEVPFKELMQNTVHNVLIVCSNYDFYLLEEDGRIDEQIFNEYSALNMRNPPDFSHAQSSRGAISELKAHNIDLVIIWLDVSKTAIEVSNKVKANFPDIPLVPERATRRTLAR